MRFRKVGGLFNPIFEQKSLVSCFFNQIVIFLACFEILEKKQYCLDLIPIAVLYAQHS